MKNGTTPHVAEFSVRQQAGHVQPLDEALAENLRAVREGRSSDWATIHIGTYDSCHAALRRLKEPPRRLMDLLSSDCNPELN